MIQILQRNNEVWTHNYQTGTKYELYRVPLKRNKYKGLKFRDVTMILYQKKNIFLIALEVLIANQMKVFVNPSEYIFGNTDHFGYVIYNCQPDFDEINCIDISPHQAENFFIMDYLNKKESVNKRELIDINQKLAKALEIEDKKNIQTNFENFYTTVKPTSLCDARVKNKLDKNIEGHIIVCGIIKGIKNLILPLRSKFQSGQKRPIVILSNDNLGDENLNGDTFIWSEINRFEEIYLIRGSALQPADLDKARVGRAKAIIILSKSYENTGGKMAQNNLDADAIFMYKTIEANYKNVVIVTELASVGAIAFLVQGKDETVQKDDYYSSKPFAAGEIFVSHLLDSLMC